MSEPSASAVERAKRLFDACPVSSLSVTRRWEEMHGRERDYWITMARALDAAPAPSFNCPACGAVIGEVDVLTVGPLPSTPAPAAEVEAALREWQTRSEATWERDPTAKWHDLLATVSVLVDAQAARHADCCVDREERDAAVDAAVTRERERCAELAARFAENYPAAVFSAPDARELSLIADHERLRFLSDRLRADMARRTSANIAAAIRQAPRP